MSTGWKKNLNLNILNKAFKFFILSIIKIYQFTISPVLGNNCRFQPSCSNYMACSIKKYGIFKGIALGLKRLAKCHPHHPGGSDPVP